MLQNVKDFLSKKDHLSLKSFPSSRCSKRSIEEMVKNKRNSQFQTIYQKNFQTTQSFNKTIQRVSVQLDKEIDDKISAILGKYSEKDRPQIEKAILENTDYVCASGVNAGVASVFMNNKHRIKMQGNFGTTYKQSFSKNSKDHLNNLVNIGMNNNRGYNTRTSLNNNDCNRNSAILDKGYSTNNRGHGIQNQKLNFEFLEKNDLPQYLNTSYQRSFFDFKNLNKLEAQPNIPHSKHFHGLLMNARPPFGYQNKKGTTYNGNFLRKIKVQNPITQIYPIENKTRCSTGRNSDNNKVENQTMVVLQKSLNHTYKADSLQTHDFQEFKSENICNNPTDCKTEDIQNTIKKIILSRVNKN